MKKFKYSYSPEDRDYWDGGEQRPFAKIKEERDEKRKKKRLESAMRSKNVKQIFDFLEYSEDEA